jgi:hypothetical protein
VRQHGVAHRGRHHQALAEGASGPAEHGERVGALQDGVRLGREPFRVVLQGRGDVLGSTDQ